MAKRKKSYALIDYQATHLAKQILKELGKDKQGKGVVRKINSNWDILEENPRSPYFQELGKGLSEKPKRLLNRLQKVYETKKRYEKNIDDYQKKTKMNGAQGLFKAMTQNVYMKGIAQNAK